LHGWCLAANGKSIHLHETNMDPLLQLPQHTPIELVSKERLTKLAANGAKKTVPGKVLL
jgi:hypothetical protein